MKMNKEVGMIIIAFALGIVAGGIVGAMIQQMIIGALLVEVGESLEGANIEVNVDLNETKLVNEFKESFIPIFNQTIVNAMENKTK